MDQPGSSFPIYRNVSGSRRRPTTPPKKLPITFPKRVLTKDIELVIDFCYRKYPDVKKVPGVPNIETATVGQTETINDLIKLISDDLSGQILKETFDMALPTDLLEIEVCANPTVSTWYTGRDLIDQGDLHIWRVEAQAGNSIFMPTIKVVAKHQKIDAVLSRSSDENAA